MYVCPTISDIQHKKWCDLEIWVSSHLRTQKVASVYTAYTTS